MTEADQDASWGYTDLLLFVGLSLLCVVLAQLAVHGVTSIFHLNATNNGGAVLAAQLLLYALLLGVLCAIIKLQYGRGFWRPLGWVRTPAGLGQAAILGVLLAFGLGFLAALLRTPDVDTPMKHLLSRRGTAIAFGVVGTTLGPLFEELVFRGFMQPVLVRSLGPMIGILITAVVFGTLHLAQNAFSWQSGLVITLAGIAFGWMRQISGSTQASTLMHSAYNFTFFMELLAQGKA